MAVDEGLPVGVVDAAGASKGGEAAFLRTVRRAPTNGHFMRAAWPRHHPGGVLRGSAGAVTVSAAPVAWNGSSV